MPAGSAVIAALHVGAGDVLKCLQDWELKHSEPLVSSPAEGQP